MQSAENDPVVSVAPSLGVIYRTMSPRLRRRLYFALVLMFLGAIAELLTIGAVVPFLALISDPEGARSYPLFGTVMAWLDGGPIGNVAAAATILLIVVAVSAALIRLLLTWVSMSFVFRLAHELAVRIFHRMLRQPYILFVQRNSSEILVGIEKVEAVAVGALLPLMLTVTSVIIAAFVVAMLFLIDPFIASIAAVTMTAIYLILGVFARRRLNRNSQLIATNRTERMKQSQEGLGGLREILLDRSQKVFERRFRRIDREMTESQAANAFLGASPRYVVEAAGVVLIAVVAFFVSLRPGGIVAAIPVLGALALGAQRLLPLLQQAYVGWSAFMANSAHIRDVVALLEAPVSSLDDPPEHVRPLRHQVECRAVQFRYPGGDHVLADIDLTIAKGERIGLVGRTGSGKSTLVDVLMGLLEPTGGEIAIDGEPLTAANRGNWQAQIAHVPQAIYLADTSIAANIAFGEDMEEIDFDRVVAAAREAQIDTFVSTLPLGYDTVIGERGIRLSGGQRQRIGIARALYKRAGVLVFDEATSALDHDTEAAVMETIDGLGRDLTVIIIAHRLSTVGNCDRVIRLDGGRIVADGPPEAVTGPALVGKRH